MGDSERDEEESVVVRIAPEFEGARLDKALAQLTEYSRTLLQTWIAEGRVTQDDELISQRTSAKANAEVTIRVAPPAALNAEPEAIALEIVYEDGELLIVNKPAGMVVHPSLGHVSGTLVNALLHHVKLEGAGESIRPGIVHRLDKDTSGLLVVAKTMNTHEKLVEQFQVHSIERRYLAIVVGNPPGELHFDTFYGRHPHHRQRFTSRAKTGKKAITHVRRLEAFAGAALVGCALETGRTHQIRVHLSEGNYPVLGDATYGKSIDNLALRALAHALGRQALHAEVLGFAHPKTGEHVRFEAKPPDDFSRALASLRSAVS